MEIKAKIEKIFPAQQITSTFKKREFVVEYAENPQYPEYIKFEFIQDKCEILDNFSAGQEVTISFNLKGRKWTDPKNGEDKYFNTLQAWKINVETNAAPASGDGNTPPPPAANDEPDWLSEDSDDLPF